MPLTRRQLILRVAQVGGYGAAFSTMHALGLLAPVDYAGPFSMRAGVGKNTKVVILGAGIAGLVAAYEMGKAGFDCTVLEARQRPGGRNWSVRKDTKIEFTDGTVQQCTFEDGHYLNAGPARLPSIHKNMLGYCKDLGVPLEVEVNTSRSTLLQNDKVLGGKPVELREAVNDTRGHVSELLAKAIKQGSLDQDVTSADKERMLSFLRTYGDLAPGSYEYKGSGRAGAKQLAGAADVLEENRDPLPMEVLLDASFWNGMMFEEGLDQQATMFQPVGGMDRIPYAFSKRLGAVVKFNTPVKEIRKTPNGVRILYTEGASGAPKAIEADYCICAMPLTVLQSVPNDFSPRVAAALKDITYASAFKVGWEARRFWEQENNIYGGISWLSSGPISLVWYPSGSMFSETGVVVSCYSQEGGSEFGKLPTTADKIAASRTAVEKLHPGRGQELTKPVYVSWGKIPYNLGSWVNGSFGNNRDGYFGGAYREFLVPDDRIYFAGDHCSHVVAWQEGAALSAQRTVNMIAERIRQT